MCRVGHTLTNLSLDHGEKYMANGNRVDELDNQIKSNDFDSGSNFGDAKSDETVGDADSDVDLTEQDVEDAVRANPKRLSAAQRKKASAIIEGEIDKAELSDPEGQEKAWEKLEEEFGTDHPVEFDISAEINANDVIDHPKFGIGFVVELVNPQKIEVLFEDGLRKLACNIDQ